MLHQFRTSHVRSGQAKLYQDMSGYIRFVHVSSCYVNVNQVGSG
jgi:hypothetical protein